MLLHDYNWTNEKNKEANQIYFDCTFGGHILFEFFTFVFHYFLYFVIFSEFNLKSIFKRAWQNSKISFKVNLKIIIIIINTYIELLWVVHERFDTIGPLWVGFGIIGHLIHLIQLCYYFFTLVSASNWIQLCKVWIK